MPETFARFGTALAIGFLVGLQREASQDNDDREPASFAGVRTFSLFALCGCTAGLLAEVTGTVWLLVATILVLGALIVAAYGTGARAGDPGMTTEVAAVLTVLAGMLCYYDQLELAAALGVALALLLSYKPELRQLAHRLERRDLLALLKFGVITAIVLPVLPNRGLGSPPFDVLNPFKVWLMVVLIAGLSFLGYGLMKVLGTRYGISLTGLLGGLASSTAVTLSFSQRSHKQKDLQRAFGMAVLIAWGTMFARVMVEVAAVNRELLQRLWPVMAAATVAALAYAAVLYRSEASRTTEHELDVGNPIEIGSALRFGALYAVILLVARTAQVNFGSGGVYVSAIVAGLGDVDAITLSLAELSRPGNAVDTSTAALGVALATLSNTVVKAGIVFVTGAAGLSRAVLPGLLLVIAAGLGAALLLL